MKPSKIALTQARAGLVRLREIATEQAELQGRVAQATPHQARIDELESEARELRATLPNGLGRCFQLGQALQQFGPLVVTAVVPDYARGDWESDQYGAWYVGHVESSQLNEDVLQQHYRDYERIALAEYPDYCADGPDGMGEFFDYLEEVGYVVLTTVHEGTVTLDTGSAGEKG